MNVAETPDVSEIPNEYRFRSHEDGAEFLRTSDKKLTIAPRINVDGNLVPNTEYINAPYALRLIWHKASKPT